MKAHPAANLFPLLEGAALQSLADDIKANGLQYPIITAWVSWAERKPLKGTVL